MSEAVNRIDVHRHCPRCGAAPMAIRPPHLTVCAACDLHLFHNVCAAAAAILVDRANRVLFIRRAKEPARGRLAFPGGFIDNGESLEDGLRREVREEVGLDAVNLGYLTSHPNTYPYRGVVYATLDLFFVARDVDFAPARPLDAVAEIVVRAADDVREDELAFVSLRAAWRIFLARGAR